MAKFPSSGVNIPGYLNTCNSPSQSGYQDAIGNPYWMGLTAGKIITLGPTEVSQFQAPGTTLYDGAYQWVQLDSGATAANATAGLAAFIKLDSGATQGALPETAYAVPTVTTEDQASDTALFAGVFLNPTTFNGQANEPTPGNWCFIFVGAGRAAVKYKASLTNGSPALGDNIVVGGGSGTFDDASAQTVAPTGLAMGKAATIPAGGAVGLIYVPDFINRIPF